jgi:type I restriction enzyme R subunit
VNAFYKGAIRAFHRDNEMRNIIMHDKDARDLLLGLMFGRALREAQAGRSGG